ncbi:PRC-barrel domain-containing protein [Rhodobacter sp. NTK016B]|uniref:PRC-barrel domain-containing protein n=1 Tax=Rhodobacter sp. NTK016B TaxID=2759676 RepID=UPI001A90BF9A|nr:PRC-barrel domain-containing protein [Rhodobacter sp. NTK016B]MBN8293098.1 PRC-barrel domain-containing protein [Rhodobacter sp. NTK016B]
MKPNKILPFALILGMTAGSTAVYAQTMDATTDPMTSADANANAELCEGENCATMDQSADATTDAMTDDHSDMATSADADATMGTTMGEAEDDAVAADEPLLPMGDSETEMVTDSDMAVENGNSIVDIATLTSSEELVGTRAYDTNDEWVGEISAVIPADAEGGEERFVIDVGGFLGIGEKPVALGSESLQVSVDADGDIDHVIVDHSMEELEAMPEVEM